METMHEFEDQKRLVRELQQRLADAENKLMEGEKLRKKLHNTILVMPMFLSTTVLLILTWLSCNTGIEREHSCILSSTTSVT